MITKKQKTVLDFIKKSIGKNGYAPSLEEIKKHFKMASVSTAHHYVEKLQEKGFIRKDENRPRAISVFENQVLVNIPLMGKIAAGRPIEAIEEKETIAVPKDKLPASGNFYALKVIGNSMVEENICDGDIVLVKQQSTAENGQKVVALVDNCEATLKMNTPRSKLTGYLKQLQLILMNLDIFLSSALEFNIFGYNLFA
jgi:SOS regulatory protein LexA